MRVFYSTLNCLAKEKMVICSKPYCALYVCCAKQVRVLYMFPECVSVCLQSAFHLLLYPDRNNSSQLTGTATIH